MPREEIKQKIMPFGEHLEELRRRLILALLGTVPILVLSLAFGRTALQFIVRPIQAALHRADLASVLQATSPLETFGSYLKVSLTITILVGLPWMLLQLWLFVAPGLYASEKRFAYLLAPMSMVLSILGMAFCYWVMLPVALAFFVNFGSTIAQPVVATAPLHAGVVLPVLPLLDADPTDPPEHGLWFNNELRELRYCVHGAGEGGGDVRPVIVGVPLVSASAIAQQYRVSEYVGFLLSMSIAFALAFQMPVVVLLLGWANIITPAVMRKYRRHAIFACAAAAAIITPTPDPFNMFLLAGPLYALYEVGLLLLRVLPASLVAEGFGGWKGLSRILRRRPKTAESDAGDQ